MTIHFKLLKKTATRKDQ